MGMESGFSPNVSSADGGSFESLLQGLAETPEFSVPDEVVSYTRAVSCARETVAGVRRVMADASGMDGAYAQAIEQYCASIERVIEDHHLEQVAASVQERVDHYNELIRRARNTSLPGTHLQLVQHRDVMTATVDHPMDVHVEGLTICGVYGQEGINRINAALAANRERQAEEAYNSIVKSAEAKPYDGAPIQSLSENSDSASDSRSEWWSVGDVQVGGAAGSAGASSGSGGVALPSFGAAGVAGAAAVAGAVALPRLGAAGSGVSAGVSSAGAGLSASSSSGRGGVGSVPGVVGAGSSGAGVGSVGRHDPYVALPSFDAAGVGDGDYVFDPVSGEWVDRDSLGASVDSAGSVSGVGAGVAGVTVGAGGALAGVRASGLSGGAVSGGAGAVSGGVALPSFGAAGGVAGAVGGSGAGSYFVNNPVAATVTPSSSIRGAQGMAAGLPRSSSGTQAAARSGVSSPAMMAGGQGAGGSDEKRERRGMAYVAPRLEDDGDEVVVKPRAAMAGHRKQMDE